MKRIVIPPQPHDVSLPFYLAAEEWVAKTMPDGEYFFAWQVNPTVICGRHQEIPLEVDLDYARLNNIDVCRRKSGGGSVYADRENVMFSYITKSDAVQTTFAGYTSMICRMLGSLGISATATGRNDIAVNDKKVAGNAFLKLPGRSIVHGTMLYNADFTTMSKILTPSRAKQMSKGVVSIPSRVTTLIDEGLQLSCSEFIDYAVNFLCSDGEYSLIDKDIVEINEILGSYLDESFLAIDRHHDYIPRAKYIDGIGEIAIDFTTSEDGLISSIDFKGDFFPLKDARSIFNDILVGIPCNRIEIEKSLEGIPLDEIILGLNHNNLKLLLPCYIEFL